MNLFLEVLAGTLNGVAAGVPVETAAERSVNALLYGAFQAFQGGHVALIPVAPPQRRKKRLIAKDGAPKRASKRDQKKAGKIRPASTGTSVPEVIDLKPGRDGVYEAC